MGVTRFPRVGRAIYRTDQWKAARLLAKRRDGWACVKCSAKGRIEVDHIVPLRDGGAPYELGNLQCLCVPCHSRKTRIEIGLGRDDPERDAWKNLLRNMQRNPSGDGEKHACKHQNPEASVGSPAGPL